MTNPIIILPIDEVAKVFDSLARTIIKSIEKNVLINKKLTELSNLLLSKLATVEDSCE